MAITSFGFLGVRTTAFAETRAFYKDTLRLRLTKDEPSAAWFETASGDEIHVYGPKDADHDFFTTGPVVGLLTDDFAATRAAMVAAGIQFIGDPQRSEGAVWNHYYGPDGCVYEIMQRTGYH